MSRYVSRKYLREKWESLKWDMEKVIDVYGEKTDDDSVSSEIMNRCYWNIVDKIDSIKKELGDWAR